ncbi:tRNA methyltransferase complex GCD14 subunit-domain-containing protein [Pholiota molesta]|nr:tRNA methyltransferase complex GCD14 subunit-domain-containing protein [Pholiota molesta]
MWSTAREVAAGDTVIIWLTRDQLQPLVVTPGKDLNTKFGNFKQADLVGVPYGSKGFIHVLRPTPELWTLALPHRTQILYLADIAFITSALHIRSGSRVVEAGTGSGSFSHSIARTIGPAGRLFSFEFHEARFLKAQEEFARHRMDAVVALQHRNVCKDGFAGAEGVDAVFLDLPAPWEAVGHAKEVMRKDRVARICCFSPCIEQVLRTVSALNEAGFTEITMYETLLRPIEVFQTPAPPSVAGLAAQLKHAEARREEKRQRQIAANKKALAAAAAAKAGSGSGKTARRAASGSGTATTTQGQTPTAMRIVPELKRARTDADGAAASAPVSTVAPPTPAPAALSASTSMGSTLTPAPSAHDPPPPKINVSKALPEVRGHTSYLTFASLVPGPRPPPPVQGATPAPGPAAATSDANGAVPAATTTSSATENAPVDS